MTMGSTLPGDVDERAAEQVLLERLRSGEDAAYEELVRGMGGRMLAVARRFLGSEDEAEDAVQEAFIQAFKNIGRFEGASRLSTWLHRIVVNAALMRLRKKGRSREISIEELLPSFLEDGHRVAPTGRWIETGEQIAERKELRQLVRDAIDRLPDNYRNVLLLRDIEQLDTEESAKILDLTVNATKTRLHRARQALRGLLDPQLQEGLS